MLRRTKEELQNDTGIFKLPEKEIKFIDVALTKEESMVYQKILFLSQNLFAQFLHQHAEKNADLAHVNGRGLKGMTLKLLILITSNRRAKSCIYVVDLRLCICKFIYILVNIFFYLISVKPNEEYLKIHRKLSRMNGNEPIQAAEIMVLILRLRQICCHPGLIKIVSYDTSSVGEQNKWVVIRPRVIISHIFGT